MNDARTLEPPNAETMDTLTDRLARLSPEQLSELMRRARGTGTAGAPASIPRRAATGPSPLSFAQQRLWFVQRLDPGNTAYNEVRATRLDGALDVPALRRALDTVVARHEALRTVFVPHDGGAAQRVVPGMRVPLEVEEVEVEAADAWEAEVGRRARREQGRPFDLEAAPPLRVRLLRLAPERHVLLLAMHHVASDGWSRDVIVRELSAAYAAAVAGAEPRLPDLPVQYPDYAAWQRERMQGPLLAEQLAYWEGRLAGAPGALELPADRPRPPVQWFVGGTHRFHVPRAVADALRALAREGGATPFMVLLAAFKTLLARYTGEHDVVVGTPVANRGRPEVQGLVGFFANTLALRTDLSGDPPFREALRRVRETALGAYAHDELPFERLVEALHPQRDPSRNPVFQAMFLLDESPVRPFRLPGLSLAPVEVDAGTSMFDLTLALETADDGFAGRLEYAAALFDAATAARMADHLGVLLRAVAADPDARLAALPLLSGADRERLAEWNATDRGYPAGSLAHELFAEQAARTPDAAAVVHGDQVLSYAALDARAGRLARHLRGRGVGPEARVGVCLDRSPELVAALLAVLKAGGAYVPLDPAYPRERLAAMVEDAGIRLVLTTAALAGRVPDGAEPVSLDALAGALSAGPAGAPGSGVRPENLSHVIFTSGSTGRPKGVMVRHSATAALLHWLRDEIADEERARVLASTSVSFDVSVAEIFGTLCWGGTLVLVGDALDLPTVAGREVRSASMVPAAAAELLRSGGIPRSVRTLNLAGEALPPDLARALYATGTVRTVRNLYGPTEDTSYSTCGVVEPGADRVLIGRPLAGTRAHVLDARLGALPVGVPGELCLAGAGVARGYQGRPGLTAERFVPDPHGPAGSRMYRTGDRARWTAGGALEYLGRTDLQVKVRGFRVEPGEVEAALRAHPAVGDAAVVARDDAPGGRGLVAYLLPAAGAEAPPAAAMRAYLRDRLPEYMVPAAFVALDAFPLTPSGKVDRRALAAPGAPAAGADAYTAPRTPLEELLAGVFAEVLGVERVGARDDFFGLGGHSLLATRLATRVSAVTGTELPLRALFDRPTVAALAEQVQALSAAGAGADAPVVPVLREGGLPLSFAQQRLWLIDQMEPGSAAYNLAAALRLRGLVDGASLERSLAGVARRHESLRTRFVQAEGGPVQVVDPPGPLPLARVDLGHLAPGEREDALRAAAAGEARRPFDLARGSLVRSTLVRLADEDHALLFTVHHAVSDGWSMGVLAREVSELYTAEIEGREAALPALPVQYPDFAAWQRRRLAGQALEAQLAWWRPRLADLPSLELPTDHPRPAAQSYRGAAQALTLPRELSDGVRRLSGGEGATVFMTLVSVLQLLLSRLSGQEDFAVGTPVAGRTRPETEGLIGCFLNNLVLRADLRGDPTFRALLARVRESLLGAFAHQEVPFETLIEALRPPREPGRTPFFQVLANMPPLDEGARVRLGSAAAEPMETGEPDAKFDLTLYVLGGDEIQLRLVYDAALFEAPTVRGMLDGFHVLLQAAVADPERRVSTLPLLRPAERARLAAAAPHPRPPVPFEPFPPEAVEGSIPARFAARVHAAPDALAVETEGHRWTYAELHGRAAQVAHALLRACGPGPGRVALFLEHDAPMVAGLLGALMAGKTYVPLDLAFPAERVRRILADVEPAALLTEAAHAGTVHPLAGGLPVLVLEEVHASEPCHPVVLAVDPDTPAYVLYTSGSTGEPKGVVQSHRNVLHHIRTYANRLHLNGADRLSLFAGYGFDAAVMDIYGALLTGAALCPISLRGEGAAELAALVVRRGVTVFHSTPTVYRHLAAQLEDGHDLSRVRLVVLGGEETVRRDLELFRRHFAPGALFVNGFGPTECTVALQYFYDGRTEPLRGPVPVGHAVEGTEVRLLNEAGEPVEVLATGEVTLRGAHVALGYWRRPELTRAAFLPDPEGGQRRMYRTGDFGRLLPDGGIAFAGRRDGQVKIRGIRIETGEVESVLRAHPGVRECVVVAREDAPGEKRLVAYLVGGADPAEVRAWLRERLPDYMVPAAFAALERLPLTPNGKLDRRALPAPPAAGEDGRAYTAPRTPTEELLAGIFAEVLGRERVGADDDFFAAGGHSLLATRVASRVRAALGAELPLRVLFQDSTPARLAAWLDARRTGAPRDAAPIPRVARPGVWLPLSFAQQRLWLVHQMAAESRVYNQTLGVRLRGALDGEALHRAVGELVRRHAVFRTRFVEQDGVPGQVIDPPREVPLPRVDLSGRPGADELLRGLVREQARRPFDLASGELFRALLVRLGEDEHALAATMHHIAYDGWSAAVMLRELAHLYHAFCQGRPSPLPEPPVQYADYAVWQRGWLTPEREDEQLRFWRDRLHALPELHLAADRGRAAEGTDGELCTFVLPAALSEGVRRLGRSLGATPFMTLLAAFKVLLHWQGGGAEVVVGTDVANRNLRPETEGLIGFFVNQLVLRTRLDGTPSFGALVARVREGTLSAYDHQDVPFDRVVEALQPRRAAGQTPFFRAKFVLQNAPEAELPALPGLRMEPLPAERSAAQLDVLLAMHDDGERIAGWFEYRTALFSPELMGRWTRRFQAVLEAAVADPGAGVDAVLAQLDADERAEMDGAREALKEKRRARFAR